MANIDRVPNLATNSTTIISQVPSLLAQIVTGSVHLLLLVAKLGVHLMLIPLLIPMLLLSLLATVAELTDKFLVGTTSKQGESQAISATRTYQEQRVEAQDRRDPKASEPSVGSYRRDSPRGAPSSASR